MARKTKTTASKKTFFDWRNNKPLALFTAVVGLTLIYFLLFSPLLNYVDKQRFVRAEVFLKEQIDEKVRPTEQPYRIEGDNTCRYTSVKIGTGTLMCHVRQRIIYESSDKTELFETADAIIRQFNEPISVRSNDDVDSILQLVDTDETFELSHVIENELEGIDCGAGYTLSNKSVSYQLEVRLSCSDEARVEHFPLSR